MLNDGVKYNATSPGCTHLQDMWSIGVILFNSLSSKFPFDHEKQNELKKKIKGIDYDFEDKCWEGISNDAKNLIEKLLTLPKQRYTADQALKHPWFKSITDPLKESLGNK